jgi:hypothetical protein
VRRPLPPAPCALRLQWPPPPWRWTPPTSPRRCSCASGGLRWGAALAACWGAGSFVPSPFTQRPEPPTLAQHAPRCRYDQGGASTAVEALSRVGGGGRNDRRITLSQIKDEGLGMGEKPEWVVVSDSRRAGVGQACAPASPRPGCCCRRASVALRPAAWLPRRCPARSLSCAPRTCSTPPAPTRLPRGGSATRSCRTTGTAPGARTPPIPRPLCRHTPAHHPGAPSSTPLCLQPSLQDVRALCWQL